jgi:hypothetical protein
MKFISFTLAVFCLAACQTTTSYEATEISSEGEETLAAGYSLDEPSEFDAVLTSQAATVQYDYPRIDGKLIDRCVVYNGTASCSKSATSDAAHATCRRLGMSSGASYTWKLEPPQQVFWWNFSDGNPPRLINHPEANTRKGVFIVLKCYQ